MERVALSVEGITLSRLIYGMWRLANDDDTRAAHIQAKIEACLEQGISSFDQADIYGDYRCEALLGSVLKDAPHLREQMQIITKCDIKLKSSKWPDTYVKHYDTSAKHIHASVDASLTHMAIDYIDILLLHRPDPLMDADETGRALDELIVAGKVKAVGVSNFTAWDCRLLQSRMQARIVTNQIELNLLHTEAFTDGTLSFMQCEHIAPMAWSPLAGGALVNDAGVAPAELHSLLLKLAEQYAVQPADIAIAWLLRHPCGVLPVMGTNNLHGPRRGVRRWLAVGLGNRVVNLGKQFIQTGNG